MSSSRPKVKLSLAIFATVLMVLEWVLLVAGTRPHEMIVGSTAVLLSALFAAAVSGTSTLALEFNLFDVAQGWRIPW
jgi:hypothetical protein